MNVYQITLDAFYFDGEVPTMLVAANTRGQAWAFARRFLEGFNVETDWTEKKTMLMVVKNFQEGAYREGVLDEEAHEKLMFILTFERIGKSVKVTTLGGAA